MLLTIAILVIGCSVTWVISYRIGFRYGRNDAAEWYKKNIKERIDGLEEGYSGEVKNLMDERERFRKQAEERGLDLWWMSKEEFDEAEMRRKYQGYLQNAAQQMQGMYGQYQNPYQQGLHGLLGQTWPWNNL